MSERLREIAAERGRDGGGAASGGGVPSEPVRLVYPPKALHGDAVRGVLGLALTAGPLFAIEPLLAVEILLLVCAAIFVAYLARTLLRYRTELRIDADGVTERDLRARRIAWDRLEQAKLRYYTTKRGRDGGGWLVLTLRGTDETGRAAKIAVESTVERFDELLAAVAEIVVRRGLFADETSVHNFAAAGAPLTHPGEAMGGPTAEDAADDR